MTEDEKHKVKLFTVIKIIRTKNWIAKDGLFSIWLDSREVRTGSRGIENILAFQIAQFKFIWQWMNFKIGQIVMVWMGKISQSCFLPVNHILLLKHFKKMKSELNPPVRFKTGRRMNNFTDCFTRLLVASSTPSLDYKACWKRAQHKGWWVECASVGCSSSFLLFCLNRRCTYAPATLFNTKSNCLLRQITKLTNHTAANPIMSACRCCECNLLKFKKA